MASFETTLNGLLALGSIGMFVLSLIIFIGIYTKKIAQIKITKKILLRGITLLTFFGIFFPLFYQYFFGYPPCMLCWYQRMFMFPAFIASAYALYIKKGKETIVNFIGLLCFLGSFVSLYHYAVQMNIIGESAICTTGATISCTIV